jgi:hypothetical protein
MIFAAALIGAATVASAVSRSLKQCPPYMCGTNGTQFDGIQIEDAQAGGVLSVVTLPSGEMLALDADAASTPRLRITKTEPTSRN